MPVSHKDILRLRQTGVKVNVNGSGQAAPVRKIPTTDELLAELIQTQRLLTKAMTEAKVPDVKVSVASPNVSVAAPHVALAAPKAKKWEFEHTYNMRGELVKTIATPKD